MSIETRILEYVVDDIVFEGMLAWDSRSDAGRPGVLVSHAWGGRGDFEDGKALKLAELGYVGFAIDVYGKGKRGQSPDENAALMQPLLDDRAMLQRRLLAAIQALKQQPEVDSEKVAAIGFCFGGLCVLDIARSGADISGVVSFHGLFSAPQTRAADSIAAKILVLHGWDDPMATPEQAVSLAEELTSLGADWQLHGYGNTMHAFTNPLANAPASGTVYSSSADMRSWNAMTYFLSEIFS
ncbi:MAG: dienelactone hydrolase family protein [Woeseiaceae bacterium]